MRLATLPLLALALSATLQLGCGGSSGGGAGTVNGAVSGSVPSSGTTVSGLVTEDSDVRVTTQAMLNSVAEVKVQFANGVTYTGILNVGQTTFVVPVNFTAGQAALVTVSQGGQVVYQQVLGNVPASGVVDAGAVDLRSTLLVQLLRSYAQGLGITGGDFLVNLGNIPGPTSGQVLDLNALRAALAAGTLGASLDALIDTLSGPGSPCSPQQVAAGTCSAGGFASAFQNALTDFQGQVANYQTAPGGGGSLGPNETPATIPAFVAGTYNWEFNTGPFPTTLYTAGQTVSFLVATDGTLTIDGSKVLSNPVLRFGNPHEAIWKDPADNVEYALSSIANSPNPPHEMNLSRDGTFTTFMGQFRMPAGP